MGFDEQEKIILKELVKDPRISDNQIALKTGLPVKSVNRKRHKLEENNIIKYYADIDHTEHGTGEFGAKKMYVISFKYGISREMFLKSFSEFGSENWEAKHIDQMMVAENNGRFVLILVIESRVEDDLIEIFNVDIVKRLKVAFGDDCIHDTLVLPVNNLLKVHHNYLSKNMKCGKLKPDIDDDKIFV